MKKKEGSENGGRVRRALGEREERRERRQRKRGLEESVSCQYTSACRSPGGGCGEREREIKGVSFGDCCGHGGERSTVEYRDCDTATSSGGGHSGDHQCAIVTGTAMAIVVVDVSCCC